MAGQFPSNYKEFMNGSTEDVWIETGTYNGNSVQRALDFGFREIHTIEVAPTTFENLTTTHPELCANTHVHRYCGSSRHILPSIICGIQDRFVVFWLDAHYSGGDQCERDGISECPLIDELTTIAVASWQHAPLICIDDANMFVDALWITDHDRGRFTRAHWPGEQQLLDVLQGWKHEEHENIFFFYQ